MLGYVENTKENTYEWVGDNLVILKRGAYFIEDLIKKTSILKPLTEEELLRQQKVKEDRMKFLSHKKDEEERK